MIEEYMKEALKEAKVNKRSHYQDGGPFGAVIVKDGNIISRGHNTVLTSHDPTAHAEINAIRNACTILKTHDLSDCIIFINAEPCPMCLSAIIWANIKTVYYANTKEEAAEIGFRDSMIYDFLKNKEKNQSVLDIKQYVMKEAKELFDDYQNYPEKTLY